MKTLCYALRYSIHPSIKNCGYVLVAMLALVISVTVFEGGFSVGRAAKLSRLPDTAMSRIMQLWESNPKQGIDSFSVSAPNYMDWRNQNAVFEHVAAYREQSFRLTDKGADGLVLGANVSANLFQALDVTPAQGRTFLPGEDQFGKERVVIVSHNLWQQRFGGSANLSGKTLTLNGDNYTVIGVMPPDFRFPLHVDKPGGLQSPPWNENVEMWLPLTMSVNQFGRGERFLRVIARLKPGITPAEARKEMESLARHLERQHPRTNTGWSLVMTPLK